MRCKKVIGQLTAYLDGQLTAAEREAVRSHVAGCARCRGELDALGRTVYAVADLPRLQAPAGLRDQVMAKLDGVAPAEARRPRWRMYWGAAAAVIFAVVIMLLTRQPTPSRAAPEPVAATGKSVRGREVALASRDESAGRAGADEKLLRTASNVEPTAGPAYLFTPAPVIAGAVAPVLSEQIVLPSADPQASYSSAVVVAARGGWLPTELQKDGAARELLKASEAEPGGHPVLQLTFPMKRSQVPLLKNALAAAGLQAAEEKGGQAEEAKQTYTGAPQIARARTNLDQAAQVPSRAAAAPVTALSVHEDRATTVNAPTAAVRAAPAMQAPRSAVAGAAGGAQPTMAEKKTLPAEVTTVYVASKVEAAEEPLVQVTLLFPLAENPVPAVPPAAGAATSATAP